MVLKAQVIIEGTSADVTPPEPLPLKYDQGTATGLSNPSSLMCKFLLLTDLN